MANATDTWPKCRSVVCPVSPGRVMKMIFFAAIRREAPKTRSLAWVGSAASSRYSLHAGGPHD